MLLETISEEIFREAVFGGGGRWCVLVGRSPITPLVAVSGNGCLSTYCDDHSHHPSDTSPFTNRIRKQVQSQWL